MEARFSYTARNYSLLTKPGIIMGNVITTAGGFALASKNGFNLSLFLTTLIGIAFVIASACVFNNYIDRNHDKNMARTKHRPLATGSISIKSALLFAITLGVIGAFILAKFTTILAMALALGGFFVYVILYSFSKYHSIHGTLIGSVAGALPPTVGYCAVSNHFDLGALILFATIALWQMPHFFAISIYRLNDYALASIPVLPVKKGVQKTKMQILFYIPIFTVTSSMLTILNFTGYVYLMVAASLGGAWFVLGLKGLKSQDDQKWARKMFFFSLIVVIGLCIAIPFSIK